MSKFFLAISNSLLKQEKLLSDYDHGKQLRLHITSMEVGFSELETSIRLPYFHQSITELEAYWDNMKLLFTTESTNKKLLFNSDNTKEGRVDENLLHGLLTKNERLVIQRDDSVFEELRKKVFESYPLLSDLLAEMTLIYLINHCYYRIKGGDDSKKPSMNIGLKPKMLKLLSYLSCSDWTRRNLVLR